MFFTTQTYIIWAIIALVFFVVEAITLGLTTIWFGGGSIVAMILAYCGFSVTTQVIAFIVISLLLLVFTRKIFVDQLQLGREKTNIDAVIGRKGIADSDFSIMEPGVINILGQKWTAIPKDEDVKISKGEEVIVVEIQGVKAIIEPVLK